MKKIKLEEVIIIPKDLDEAAEFLRDIREQEDKIKRIQADMNEKIGELKIAARVKIKEHEATISKLGKGIYDFAEAHRKQLIKYAKARAVELPTGFFGWRLTRRGVIIRNAKAVLDMLLKTKVKCFKPFLRKHEVVTYEIDREAMLKNKKDAEKIEGVWVGKHEIFWIKPEGVEKEIIVAQKCVL